MRKAIVTHSLSQEVYGDYTIGEGGQSDETTR